LLFAQNHEPCISHSAPAAVGHRCAQVEAGLIQALGGVSLAGLEQALAAFIAGFEQCWDTCPGLL
jgi:hypothetical protein